MIEIDTLWLNIRTPTENWATDQYRTVVDLDRAAVLKRACGEEQLLDMLPLLLRVRRQNKKHIWGERHIFTRHRIRNGRRNDSGSRGS